MELGGVTRHLKRLVAVVTALGVAVIAIYNFTNASEWLFSFLQRQGILRQTVPELSIAVDPAIGTTLEFSVENDLFCGAFPVQYDETYP